MPAPVVGTKNDNQAANAASLAITLTNAPSVGGLVVVMCAIYTGNGGGTKRCTATGGSGITITERVNTVGTAINTVGVLIWTVDYATAPTSLTIDDAIGASTMYLAATCVNVTGQNASYFDVAGSGAATGTAATASGMGDLTDSTDLVLGVMTRSGTTGTITPDANWTQIVEIDEPNATYQTLNAVQRTPGATGAYDPAWTLSVSDSWVAGGIAIKGTAGGGGGGSVRGTHCMAGGLQSLDGGLR